MAALGFLVMGVLFGFALTLVLGAFVVILQSEENRALLRVGRLPLLQVLGIKAEAPASRVDFEPRIRALQEELKVTQRLVDQGRVEREQRLTEQRQLGEELATLRRAVSDRDERLKSLQQAHDRAVDQARFLEQEISSRSDELSKANGTLKDLRTELDVVQSADGVTVSQVQRLQKERDALAQMVKRLKQALAQAQADAKAPGGPGSAPRPNA